MTIRDFLTAVSTASVDDDIKSFAVAELAKLDNRNAKRRATPTKEQVANEGVKNAIVAAVGEGARLAAEIAAIVGVSTQKVSALAKQLVDNGVLMVADVKVKGKGTVKAYRLTNEVGE